MPNLNKVMLIGNLTRDPELRFTPSGKAVAELGLAINRIWYNEQNQKQEETTFVDVTVWGRAAENAAQYLQKGRSVLVEGRLQMETWQDKQSGQERSKLRVVADTVQFLGSSHEAGPSDDDDDRDSRRSEGRREDRPEERRESSRSEDRRSDSKRDRRYATA
jgi:single-strand DNA-binding protein